jgi:NAD(P)-dependent dehydrogenase (short-subunit alcohol dehydrogenase family)
VTGASSGIGAAVAKALAAAGAAVLVNYHSDEDGVNRVAEAIKRSGGEAIAFQADVSKESARSISW